jgi:hypothetical protein
MIMSHLKYTSGHARRKLVEMAAGKMKMAFAVSATYIQVDDSD